MKSQPSQLTVSEREEVQDLIKAFEGHGCGTGLDVRAQGMLRHMLEVVDEVERLLTASNVQG